MGYRIENTFGVPTQDEWDKYLDAPLFKDLLIDEGQFTVAQDIVSEMVFDQSIRNYIRQHNNKVGTLRVSYVLCRHYFDQNIPDDPWFASPGKDGQSIQYMPKFQPEDWLKRYWFSYFSEAMYYKIFSIWDSVIGFINEYYQMEHEEDLRFRGKVMKTLKARRKDIAEFLSEILEDPIYKEANKYRTRIVHGTTPNDVSSGVSIKRNIDTEIIDRVSNGAFEKKKVKASFQLSYGVGKYTKTKEIMDNLEAFCEFSGRKIRYIMGMISKDSFSVRF